jgi:hypothetical protein
MAAGYFAMQHHRAVNHGENPGVTCTDRPFPSITGCKTMAEKLGLVSLINSIEGIYMSKLITALVATLFAGAVFAQAAAPAAPAAPAKPAAEAAKPAAAEKKMEKKAAKKKAKKAKKDMAEKK